MKRTIFFPVCFLAALLLTLTASAADSVINRVTLNGGAVTVNLTAESPCALFVALYDADGRLLTVQTRNVAVTNGADIAVTIPGGIPAGSTAKASLMGADNRPVCKAVSASAGGGDTPAPGNDSDVYAILYADGTLVFQYGDTPQTGRQVRETFAVDVTETYNFGGNPGGTPWYNARAFITQVDFADKIQPTSTVNWFNRCQKLQEVKNIKNLDTSNVTDMSYMFIDCSALTTLDVSAFNTANVTDMSGMFRGCGALTALDVSGFNTVNVTDMSYMFSSCGALTALDVSGFNTVNVTDMSYMFYECSALTTLDVSGFDTANVTVMYDMFGGCSALTTLDLSGFDTSNVTNMSYMFYYCSALTVLDLSAFNTANVTVVGGMFMGCECLITIYASEKFVTSQVTSGDGMFYNDFLIGGNGTTYDDAHRGVEYARIDGGPSAPGYFTAK